MLIASDGPRLSAQRPTLYLGSRGALNMDFSVDLREGAHHSGNWGGLLANPGVVLAHALASIITRDGRVLVPELLPAGIPGSVRARARRLRRRCPAPTEPAIDDELGRAGPHRGRRRCTAGTPSRCSPFAPAIPTTRSTRFPARATAHCQVRFVAGTDPQAFVPALRRHLDAHGFGDVQVSAARQGLLPRDAPRPRRTRGCAGPSIRSRRTTGARPAVLPNIGGSLPNDCFADILGLPTLWVPHSYAGCSQHAPDEHVLGRILREGLQIMTGLFWDLAEGTPAH